MQVRFSRELSDKQHEDNSVWMELLRRSKSALSVPVAARLLVFMPHLIVRPFVFQGFCGSGERVTGKWQVKMPQKFLFLPQLSYFSLNKHFLVARFWWIAKILKKIFLWLYFIFANALTILIEEWCFRGSCSVIPVAVASRILP